MSFQLIYRPLCGAQSALSAPVSRRPQHRRWNRRHEPQLPNHRDLPWAFHASFPSSRPHSKLHRRALLQTHQRNEPSLVIGIVACRSDNLRHPSKLSSTTLVGHFPLGCSKLSKVYLTRSSSGSSLKHHLSLSWRNGYILVHLPRSKLRSRGKTGLTTATKRQRDRTLDLTTSNISVITGITPVAGATTSARARLPSNPCSLGSPVRKVRKNSFLGWGI